MKGPVAFVTEAGPAVGLGHVRRCLHLARALGSLGAQVRFFLQGPAPLPPDLPVSPVNLADPAEAVRAAAPSFIVADSYALDAARLGALRAVAPLAVVDDLAREPFPADLVVNAAPHAPGLPYAKDRTLLLGPRFALLDAAYAGVPPKPTPPRVRRVLVVLGGAPPPGASSRAARAAALAMPDASVDVVLGPFADEDEAEALAGASRTSVYRSPPGLYNHIVAVDLAVSSGGQTTFELAAAGVPAVLLTTAPNQAAQVGSWVERGAAIAGPPLADLERLGPIVAALDADPERRRRLSEAGRRDVDGRGAERVAAEILRWAR